MRVPRIHTAQPLASGDTLLLEEDASHHLLRVLRLKPGQPLVLFNGDDGEYHAVYLDTEARQARLEIGKREQPARESPLHIELGQGVSRGERMDFVLQKAVELGVTVIQPLWTRRTQVRLKGARLERKQQHWRGVVRAACEQSGRLQVPPLQAPQAMDDWCNTPEPGALRLVLDPEAGSGLGTLDPAGNIRLLIGPEGGLEREEIERAEKAGFRRVRLGPRILRTETAALAAITAIQTLWGDLG